MSKLRSRHRRSWRHGTLAAASVAVALAACGGSGSAPRPELCLLGLETPGSRAVSDTVGNGSSLPHGPARLIR